MWSYVNSFISFRQDILVLRPIFALMTLTKSTILLVLPFYHSLFEYEIHYKTFNYVISVTLDIIRRAISVEPH